VHNTKILSPPDPKWLDPAQAGATWTGLSPVIGCRGVKATTPACNSCNQSAGLFGLLADKGCQLG
jgi:hypothetical protein